MTFGQALELLKEGKKVKRKDWGGYWFLAKDLYLTQDPKVLTLDFKEGLIVACLKDNGGYAPAQPYQADLLAEDWEVVE